MERCSGEKVYSRKFKREYNRTLKIPITKCRSTEQKIEFKDRYRWRAGVEATMSELDRPTGVKRLRFQGFKAVRFSATLKTTGINLLPCDTDRIVYLKV